MIRWIQSAVQTVSYLIVINGEPTPFFLGRQGLRQGDPLSPLLFTLVMEYLSRMIQFSAKEPQFWFHSLCKGLKLTNLAFAGDLLMFCKGNEHSVTKLNNVLEQFANTAI